MELNWYLFLLTLELKSNPHVALKETETLGCGSNESAFTNSNRPPARLSMAFLFYGLREKHAESDLSSCHTEHVSSNLPSNESLDGLVFFATDSNHVGPGERAALQTITPPSPAYFHTCEVWSVEV